jgi:hypothetical protein
MDASSTFGDVPDVTPSADDALEAAGIPKTITAAAEARPLFAFIEKNVHLELRGGPTGAINFLLLHFRQWEEAERAGNVPERDKLEKGVVQFYAGARSVVAKVAGALPPSTRNTPRHKPVDSQSAATPHDVRATDAREARTTAASQSDSLPPGVRRSDLREPDEGGAQPRSITEPQPAARGSLSSSDGTTTISNDTPAPELADLPTTISTAAEAGRLVDLIQQYVRDERRRKYTDPLSLNLWCEVWGAGGRDDDESTLLENYICDTYPQAFESLRQMLAAGATALSAPTSTSSVRPFRDPETPIGRSMFLRHARKMVGAAKVAIESGSFATEVHRWAAT